MGTFSKIKKFSKPSHKIDEKIEKLNQSIKKSGLLSETMTNSTSGLYSVTQYNDAVPAVPPTYSNVPDSSGVTGDSFVQNDITNDNTGYNDSSQLFNPNIGENPTPIFYTPPAAAALGGCGIAIFQGFYATVLGYVQGDGNYFTPVMGTSDPYFYYPNDVQLSELQLQYLPYFENIYNTPSKVWSAWVPYSEYDFGVDALIKTTSAGTFALRGIHILNIPNTYQSNPGSPYQPPSTTVLQRTNLGDPNYFPGLIGKLGLGQIGSKVLLASAKNINFVLNRAGYTRNLLNAIPAAASTLFTYLRTNVPGAKDGQGNSIYGAHTPGNANYRGPYIPPISNAEKQNISNTLTLAIQSANNNQGVKNINNLTPAELNHINAYMSGNINPSSGKTNTAGLTYYNIFHNLASKNSIKQNPNGGYTITDNYRFTDNVDVSVPILRPIVAAIAAQNPKGSYPYVEYSDSTSTGKEIGRLNNMSIQVTLPPPKSVKKEDNEFEVEKFILENSFKKKIKENEDIFFANLVIEYFPEYIEYLRTRYPKNDPRLSELRYKMDQMLSASNEYLDTQFPENQRLFKKVQHSIKRNIKLTDPKTYKNVPDPVTIKNLLSVDYVNETGVEKKKLKLQNRNKKTAARFLKKNTENKKVKYKMKFNRENSKITFTTGT